MAWQSLKDAGFVSRNPGMGGLFRGAAHMVHMHVDRCKLERSIHYKGLGRPTGSHVGELGRSDRQLYDGGPQPPDRAPHVPRNLLHALPRNLADCAGRVQEARGQLCELRYAAGNSEKILQVHERSRGCRGGAQGTWRPHTSRSGDAQASAEPDVKIKLDMENSKQTLGKMRTPSIPQPAVSRNHAGQGGEKVGSMQGGTVMAFVVPFFPIVLAYHM
jgi:hypothetical protein